MSANSGETASSLHNRQVVEADSGDSLKGGIIEIDAREEVEDEATTVLSDAEAGASRDHVTGDEPVAESPIPLRQDTVLLAAIASAALIANPGAMTTLHVQLVNNGNRTAVFELLIEGWIDPAWLAVNPVYQELKPGEQATIGVDITPPRESTSRAGPRQIVVVLRSADYPGRESRQAVTLTLSGYDDVAVGDISPHIVHTSWRQRSASFSVPVTNSGNRPAQVRVQGQSPSTTFHLQRADDSQRATGPFLAQEALVDLEPGQTENVRGTLYVEHMPFLRQRTDRYRILANVVGKEQVPRAANGQVVCRQRIGTRQILLMAALLLLVVMALSILGVTGLGLMQLVASLPSAADPPAAADPAQEPAIALILPLDTLAPTSDPAASASIAGGAPIVVSIGDDGRSDGSSTTAPGANRTGREASVPLVQAGEVSVPGAAAGFSEPTPEAVTSSRDGLTYAQMFQDIALRYDLDWRMLAAQAYVESKFDTLALGNDGDLGLMQVLPRTWQEWAPVVDVNDPFDAYSNALVAAVYLDSLRSFFTEQGYPEVHWMLVAYNWGPDKLDRFLADGNTWDDLPQSLQHYATEILRIADSLSD